MAMLIQISGREEDGAPCVTVQAGGGYSPDVMRDLKARAMEMFTELFDVDTEYETEEPGELVGDQEGTE